MNIEEARQYFPHTKENKIYFNHAAIGPISDFVLNDINKYLFERNSGVIEVFEKYFGTVLQTRAMINKLINGKDKKFLTFQDNVSNCMNLLANSLNFEKGDRIILNDLEFPANIYPFLNLRNKGVDVVIAKSENGKVDLEQIEKYVNRKTKLISISHVQFLSGYCADLEKIGDYCSSNNIIFAVDAIQGAGVRKIDVQRMKIDFLAGGAQKWLMGLQGVAYAYIDEKLLDKMNQAYVGWASVKNPWDLLDYNLDLRCDSSRFETGTKSLIGIVALNSSLKFIRKIGFDKIEERILSNTKYFVDKLSSFGYDVLLKNVAEGNLSGIVTIKHPKSEELFALLKSNNIEVAMRQGMIRFSPHFYNSKDEIEKVISVLSET